MNATVLCLLQLGRIANDKCCPNFARFMCVYDMALGVCQQRMSTSRRLRFYADASATNSWLNEQLSQNYNNFLKFLMQRPDLESYIFIDNACRKYEQRFQRVGNATTVQSRTFTVVGTVIAREEFGEGASTDVPEFVCVTKNSSYFGQSVSRTAVGAQFATCLGVVPPDNSLEFRQFRTMHEQTEACPDIANISNDIRMPVSTDVTELDFFEARLEDTIHYTLASVAVVCKDTDIKAQVPPWDADTYNLRIHSTLDMIAGRKIVPSVPARIIPHPAFHANEMTKEGMAEILLTVAETRPFRFPGSKKNPTTGHGRTDQGRPFLIGDQLTMKNIRSVQESTEDSIFEGTERKNDLKHLIEVAQRVHSVDEVNIIKRKINTQFK